MMEDIVPVDEMKNEAEEDEDIKDLAELGGELDTSGKLKSPARQRLFRTCKSPLVKLTGPGASQAKSSTPRKPVKGKPSTPPEKEGLEITQVIQKFPEIHENFEITKKAGEGTFSKVYLAKLRNDPTQIFALKHLIPTSSPGRIENELRCLQLLGGENNVLPVKCALRNDDHIIFILPYVPHSKFTDYMQGMSVDDIQQYMYHLLLALRHVHQLGIIHRDIKPSNFLYSRQLDRYCLIDFGLAMPVPGLKDTLLNDYTNTNTDAPPALGKSTHVNKCKHAANRVCDCCKGRPRQNAPRAGTPGFRSPEVLMRHPAQTTAVDMWAAGVILLSILSRRYPFFKAKDDMEALAQIITIFGSAKLKKMADTIDKDFVCVPSYERAEDVKTLCEKLAQRKCTRVKDPIIHSTIIEDTSEVLETTIEIPVETPEVAAIDEKLPIDTETNTEDNNLTDESVSNSNKRKHEDVTEEQHQRPTAGNNPLLEKNMNSEMEMLSSPAKRPRGERKVLCMCKECKGIPASAYDLLERLIELDPKKRISAEDALKHPFITMRQHSPSPVGVGL